MRDVERNVEPQDELDVHEDDDTVDPARRRRVGVSRSPVAGGDASQSNRRAVVALLGLGVLALVGTLIRPESRTVLFALAGVGLFGAVLVRYLSPARFVPEEVGQSIYSAHALTGEGLVGDHDLSNVRVYVPTGSGDDEPGVRLFVPSSRDFVVPDVTDLRTLAVGSDDRRQRGVVLPPTGGELSRDFRSDVDRAGPERPRPLAERLADALVAEYELVERASVSDVEEHGSVTVAITASAFGPADRFDHPVPSFLGVTLAAALDVPVRVAVTPADGTADYAVTCEWDGDDS